MKKTTYILLSALALMFISFIIAPIIMNLINNKEQSIDKELNIDSKKYRTENYSDISAIKFINLSKSKRMILCNANISPSDNNTTISIPDSKYFSTTKKGDTLIVTQNISVGDKNIIKINSDKNTIDISIKTGKNLKYINGDINFNININDMNGDSIIAESNHGAITFNKSTFKAVNFKGWSSSFNAKESTIDSLYIDTDNNVNWTVKKCNINTEFITGSDYTENFFSKGECEKLVWIPKGKKAKIVLGGEQKFIITPCSK